MTNNQTSHSSMLHHIHHQFEMSNLSVCENSAFLDDYCSLSELSYSQQMHKYQSLELFLKAAQNIRYYPTREIFHPTKNTQRKWKFLEKSGQFIKLPGVVDELCC
jgi:hypothetical protein